MSCRKWAVHISKWHEGELDNEGEAALLRHLESCRQCRSLEARFRAVSALLSESHELPVPDFLSQRITASVSERMRQRSGLSFSGLIGFLSYRYRGVVTTGILVIGLCLGGLAGHNLAGFAKMIPARPPYDLLALGGIGGEGQSVTFSHIWQDNGQGVRP